MADSALELTPAQLDELRADLERTLLELEEQLDGMARSSQTVELDQQVQGRLSRMDALQQQAMSQAGERQAKLLRVHVERALQALSVGEYGRCDNCDLCIGFPRLKARPDSNLCVQCAQAAEF